MTDPTFKRFWKSWTIWWHGILASLGALILELPHLAAPVIDRLGPAGLSDAWVARIGIVLTLIGVVGMGLRIKTRQPIMRPGK